MDNFSTEWQLLQNQYDSYEKCALAIKLLAVILVVYALVVNLSSVYTAVFIAILWLQDAIWKTFQSRIENRLYVIEEQLAAINTVDAVKQPAFQFNRNFLANRQGHLALIKTYLLQAIRPTIAYPYVVLLLLVSISPYL